MEDLQDFGLEPLFAIGGFGLVERGNTEWDEALVKKSEWLKRRSKEAVSEAGARPWSCLHGEMLDLSSAAVMCVWGERAGASWDG